MFQRIMNGVTQPTCLDTSLAVSNQVPLPLCLPLCLSVCLALSLHKTPSSRVISETSLNGYQVR